MSNGWDQVDVGEFKRALDALAEEEAKGKKITTRDFKKMMKDLKNKEDGVNG